MTDNSRMREAIAKAITNIHCGRIMPMQALEELWLASRREALEEAAVRIENKGFFIPDDNVGDAFREQGAKSIRTLNNESTTSHD